MRRLHWRPKVVTAVVTGAVLVGIVAWSLRPTSEEVDAAPVRRGALRVTIDEEGRTRVRERFVVTAPVTGRVQRIRYDEGDVVVAGATIAHIAPMPLDEPTRQQALARLASAEALAREAATHVAGARAAEENSRLAAERRAKLYAAGGISLEDRDAATLAYRARRDERSSAESRASAAGAEVRAARAALLALGGPGASLVNVRAPSGGTVLRIPEHSERIVTAGTPIVEIGDPSRIEVIADLLSTDAVAVCVGDEVAIDNWGGEAALRGRVRAIEPSAFTRVSALGVDEQRVNVLIDVLDVPATLRDGFRVETRITVWEGRDVLSVPASALFQRGGAWSVFVIEEGRARVRAVTIGHRTSADVEVLRGLSAGETVILFPSDQIGENLRVRVRSS